MNLEEFSPFSIMHGVVLVVLTVITTVGIVASRRLNSNQRRRCGFLFGICALALWIGNQFFWLVFKPESGESLPLHLCDIAGFVAAGALLFPLRYLHALLYYWGLGLSSLAFVIPVLEQGPISATFWWFWLTHWIIVAAAIYLVAVSGFQPRWKDLLGATSTMIGIGLLTFVLNQRWDSNYMYTGDHPMPTPGDFSLDWPIPRLPVFGLVAFTLMLAAHFPWLFTQSETER